jgi:hypothetical protein
MSIDEQVLDYLRENGKSLASDIKLPGLTTKAITSALCRLAKQELVERTIIHGGRKRASSYAAIGSIPQEEEHIYILRNLPRKTAIHA